MKYAPAPWKFVVRKDGYYQCLEDVDGNNVFYLRDEFPGYAECGQDLVIDFGEESDANLIAAAPDLYAACKAVLQDCHDLDMFPINGPGREETAFEMIIAAMSKAEGK